MCRPNGMSILHSRVLLCVKTPSMYIAADVLERIEDVVLNRRPDAGERLIEMAERLKGEKEAEKAAGASLLSSARLAWRKGTLEERLVYALTKGIADYLESDLAEALEQYPKAVDITNTIASPPLPRGSKGRSKS